MKTIHHLQTKDLWHGHISLEQTSEWTRAWRLPLGQLDFFPPEGLQQMAAAPAGVRLAFHSDTRIVSGSIVAVEDNKILDLCCDGVLISTVDLDNQSSFYFDDLPDGEKLIELWLPPRGDFRLRELQIDDNAELHPHDDRRPKWMTYGSSITHCAEAQSPAQTWPALVARERNLNLTCLGFGGQCHLDSMVARVMRDQPADFISLCVGINIHGGSLAPRAFLPALFGFVHIIREKHPRTPLLLISPLYSPPRETEPNAVCWTLPIMREEIETAYHTFRAHGDENIYYINGLELLGPEYLHLLPDQLHPNAEGYKQLARNFVDKAGPLLFGNQAQ